MNGIRGLVGRQQHSTCTLPRRLCGTAPAPILATVCSREREMEREIGTGSCVNVTRLQDQQAGLSPPPPPPSACYHSVPAASRSLHPTQLGTSCISPPHLLSIIIITIIIGGMSSGSHHLRSCVWIFHHPISGLPTHVGHGVKTSQWSSCMCGAYFTCAHCLHSPSEWIKPAALILPCLHKQWLQASNWSIYFIAFTGIITNSNWESLLPGVPVMCGLLLGQVY